MALAIVQPLLHRSIRRIWTGQVLAAIGTQLYSVALLWTAVGILGPDAGYLATLEAAAVLFGSLLGGALTDGWHPKVTLVAADLARGAVVLALPLGQALGGMSPELLVAVALSVGIMTGCFEPTLQAALVPLAPERGLRHATNGLFDATRRLARIAGPALVFLVHQAVSTIYFFVVTATTFAASAAAIAGSAIAARGPERRGAGGAVIAGFRALRGRPLVIYALCTSAVANVAWAGGYLFGMALVFHDERAESLTGYSLMACAYGAGNLVSNVVLAGRPPIRAARWIIASKLIFGGGLVLLSCGLPLPWLMLVAAVTAVNGPLADLAVLYLMQSTLPASLLVHAFRAQTCIVWSGMLVGYLIAPQLIEPCGEPTPTPTPPKPPHSFDSGCRAGPPRAPCRRRWPTATAGASRSASHSTSGATCFRASRRRCTRSARPSSNAGAT